MSKYFTSVYKNYLDKIESNKDIETNCNALNDKIALLDTAFNNYVKNIENSSWTEKCKDQVLQSYIPTIRNSSTVLKNGVLNNLSTVVKLIKTDLYEMLVELKEKDEEYCEYQEKLNLEEMNSSDSSYSKGKLEAMDKLLTSLVKNVDSKIIEIKSYNSIDTSVSGDYSYYSDIDLSLTADELIKLYKDTHIDDSDDSILGKLKAQVEENKIKKLFSSSNLKTGSGNSEEDLSTMTIEYGSQSSGLENGNCVDLSLLGCDWKVVNTALSVSEYATDAYNRGIRQNSNAERYGDLCLAFSYVHASNLYNGSTGDNAESAYNWNHAGEFTDYFNDNKQETLNVIYDQISEGKPVVMQVNGNKAGTSRHFVTVVGIKSDVTSAENLTEDDLLILDSWDCNLERMDTETSRFMTTGSQTNKSYSGYYLRLLK